MPISSTHSERTNAGSNLSNLNERSISGLARMTSRTNSALLPSGQGQLAKSDTFSAPHTADAASALHEISAVRCITDFDMLPLEVRAKIYEKIDNVADLSSVAVLSQTDHNEALFQFRQFTKSEQTRQFLNVVDLEETHATRVIQFCLKSGVGSEVLNAMDRDRETVLKKAVNQGYARVVKILVDHPAIDVNLSYPLEAAAKRGDTPILDILLSHPNINVTPHKASNMSAIEWAVLRGHLKIVARLLEHKGSELDSSLLISAASYGNIPITNLLLDAGADANVMELSGTTPLAQAARKGNTELLAIFLNLEGICPDAGGPLILNANGHIDAVKLLLSDSRINPNKRDFRGNSALSESLRYGYTKVTTALVNDLRVNLTLAAPLLLTEAKATIKGVNMVLSQLGIDLKAPHSVESSDTKHAASASVVDKKQIAEEGKLIITTAQQQIVCIADLVEIANRLNRDGNGGFRKTEWLDVIQTNTFIKESLQTLEKNSRYVQPAPDGQLYG